MTHLRVMGNPPSSVWGSDYVSALFAGARTLGWEATAGSRAVDGAVSIMPDARALGHTATIGPQDKVAYHVHGNPFIPHGNYDEASWKREEQLSTAAVGLHATDHSLECSSKYGPADAKPGAVAGYPIHWKPEFRPSRRLRQRLIMPGRIDLCRMPMFKLAVATASRVPTLMMTRQSYGPSGVPFFGKGTLRHKSLTNFQLRTGCPPATYRDELRIGGGIVFIASSSDTFNLSAIEALLHGVPVIAPRHGPFKDYLPDTWLYDAWDVGEAVERILLMFEGWKYKRNELCEEVIPHVNKITDPAQYLQAAARALGV